MNHRVIFPPTDYWTASKPKETCMTTEPCTELDHATNLVHEALTGARNGVGLDIDDIWHRWNGSPITLLAAALLAAVPTEDADPHPAPRDFRRATAFLAGWATHDPAMFSVPVGEAEADGRMHHLLAAVAEHAVLALGLRVAPEQLAELRRAIAIWTKEEHTK